MDYWKIISQYYSKWLGQDNILNENGCDIKFLHSPERDKIQNGYGQPFDLYITIQPDRIILSYGNKMLSKIEDIKSQITSVIPIDHIKQNLFQIFGTANTHHNIKYYMKKVSEGGLNSRPLTVADYPRYYDFFMKNHKNCINTSWLKAYFIDMVKDHLCCGLFINNILASCSDAPCMPYMQDEVQEIGISTLEIYQGRGYATDVCINSANEIIKSGKCPLWSTSVDNIPSQKPAKKVGFMKFADVLTVTL